MLAILCPSEHHIRPQFRESSDQDGNCADPKKHIAGLIRVSQDGYAHQERETVRQPRANGGFVEPGQQLQSRQQILMGLFLRRFFDILIDLIL